MTRRIQGDPFLWKWVFLHDGKLIAYETGPLHFVLTCELMNLQSGRILGTYDCYNKDLTAPQTPALGAQA